MTLAIKKANYATRNKLTNLCKSINQVLPSTKPFGKHAITIKNNNWSKMIHILIQICKINSHIRSLEKDCKIFRVNLRSIYKS